MPKNDIAVVTAAFNSEATIARAVASALEQNHVAEVCVIDDASRDDSVKAARSADDGSGRLKIITLPDNRGPAHARNIALDAVQSPYVCILDADDYFLPGRIERLLHAGAGEPWDILADDIVIVPTELAHTDFSLLDVDGAGEAIRLDLARFVDGNIPNSRFPRREYGFLKPIMSRGFLQKHALRYDEGLKLGEDYALYARVLAAGARFRVVGACGYVAVERHDSISSLHSAGDLASLADFDTRLLVSEAKLSDTERKSLTAHRWNTLCKHRYRSVLDRKKENGMLAALGMLASDLRFFPYVASETFWAKVAAMRTALIPRGTIGGPRRIRLLLGLPQVRLLLR